MGLIQDTWKKIKSIKPFSYFFHVKGSHLKIDMQDTLPWTVIGRDIKVKTFQKMYNGYHQRYKYSFLKPVIWFGMWIAAHVNKAVLGKAYIKTENVPKDKCNRVVNVWNKSIEQSLRESALLLKQDLKGYNNPLSEAWLKLIHFVNEIFMHNVLYDTVYKGVFEIFALNLTLNMIDEYKDDPNHILYHHKGLEDINYFMAVQRNDKNHLVLNTGKDIIVVRRGDAVRLVKKDLESMIQDLELKQKEGNKNVKPNNTKTTKTKSR